QNFLRQLAVEDLLANLRHATRAERVSGARPSQRRLLFFVRFQQRLVRPFRSKSWLLLDLVEGIEHQPGTFSGVSDSLFCVLYGFVHFLRSSPEQVLLLL